eukprot:TRINITY_DN2824_c0_g1_i1.p1 TRINITY_DN2824_c0_g1~~TRINITY_DN2824_c0_g1_i1.p1  ORF type:complete len:150 (-),score=46.74 TRINITY_DN2824_c0_g1_i1:195-644(-)
MAMRTLLTLLLLGFAAAEEDVAGALVDDGECEGGEACALNALQHRAAEQEENEQSAEEYAEAEGQESSAEEQEEFRRAYANATGGHVTESGEWSGSGCKRTIPHSSCMVFHCKVSRGPVDCGITTGYYCKCGPGWCTDGYGCVPGYGYY